jgi:hypothetical protein
MALVVSDVLPKPNYFIESRKTLSYRPFYRSEKFAVCYRRLAGQILRQPYHRLDKCSHSLMTLLLAQLL